MLKLIQTKRTEENLLEAMKVHYSSPKGFVGRNICYAIYFDSVYYGHIVAGSATLNLPGRNEFFGLTDKKQLNNIANNVFFHIEKVNGTFTGKRVWNYSQLRPKIVFCYSLDTLKITC